MRRIRTTTVATYSLLSAAAVVSFLLPSNLSIPGASAAAGDVVYLPGTIRDFHKTSVDLNVTPSAGNGHYAGNIAQALGANSRPTFVGGGFKVATEWKDKNANPIAPNMFLGTGAGMQLVSAPTIDANAFFDTWDSFKGPYGGANVGPAPTITTGAAMPAVSVPAMGANSGNKNYTGTVTLSADIHCNSLTTVQNTVMNINGNLTILCESNFTFAKNTTLNMQGSSSLRLYVKGAISINQASTVNMNTFDPSRLTIYNLGTSTVEINQSNKVCAVIISPQAGIHLAQNDNVYGNFIGTTMKLDQSAGFHWDGIQHKDACNVSIKDVPGTRGANSAGGITSAASFTKWFTDELGTNMSMNYKLELTKNSSTGVYEYLSDQFHPVDNVLFGNEGQAHNYYFTLMIDVKFKHKACAGTFFEFQGADDAWMFVGNQLAIDLGGIVPGTSQHIDMDRLSLVDGQTYNMRFFFAQRNTSVSTFRVRTNMDFVQTPETYTVTATGD